MKKSHIDDMAHSGAKVKQIPKSMTIDNIGELVNQLKVNAATNNEAMTNMVEALNKMIETVANKEHKPTDMKCLVEAVKNLKLVSDNVSTNSSMDYQLDFERDQRGLFKTGMRFTAIPRIIN